MSDQSVLWRPTPESIRQSKLKQFEEWLVSRHNLQFGNYQEMWRWSVENPGFFWECCWNYFNIISDTPYQAALQGNEMPFVRWFEGARLNYAEHIFRQRNSTHPALIFQSEQQATREIGWQDLERQVGRLQQFLIRQGITEGDRVVAYLPNIPEAIVAFLAVNSIGAVWSCCSPDFGVPSVIARFQTIEPKLLIAADGYRYNGKAYDRTEAIEEIRREIPSIKQTLLIPHLNDGSTSSLSDTISWRELDEVPEPANGLSFTRVPFDHPIWILYSSGTTGKPKAITHSHGGVLLEHLKYLILQNDVHPGERFFWFTTTGWMMWNFLQASMLAGGVPVLYDGSPGYPDMDVLWKMAADLRIQHFGVGAPYLVANMKQGRQPGGDFDLTNLRSIGSTGAPLPPEAFDWVYDAVSSDVWLCSMSGGTDICTAFVGSCPYLPVERGLIQTRALGCALFAYDETGKRVVGELGEMVVEQPMPSMPIYFWNDEHNTRFLSSYFEQYPGKWRHGDWIRIFDNGALLIQGRSDATLNRKGIRIGTAEIYAALDALPEIVDSMVLNLEKEDGGDVMPLFVKLAEGMQLDEELRRRVSKTIRSKCSPRHVPDEILSVPDIPYTLSGKKMEVPVKRILLGMNSGNALNKDVVRNPGAVEFFLEFAAPFRKQYL